MAWAFVQNTDVDGGSGGLNQQSKAYANPQTLHNTNVVWIFWNSVTSTVSSVTDDRGNTYVPIVALIQGNVCSLAIYAAYNIAASAAGNTVLVKLSGSEPFLSLAIAEFSGGGTQIRVEQANSATGSGTTPDSGSITTLDPDDLLIGGSSTNALGTAGEAGWTSFLTPTNKLVYQYKIPAATGTFNSTSTMGSSTGWSAGIASLQMMQPLSGAIAARATLTGRLNANPNALAGLVTAHSNVSGTFYGQAGLWDDWDLWDSSVSVWDFTSAFQALAGVITAHATLSGTLNLNPNALKGTISAKATATGTLYVIRPLSGTISAKSNVTGAVLLNPNALSGTVSAKATVTGLLGFKLPLAGTITGKATVTGAIRLNPLALQGTASPKATVTGSLRLNPNALKGTITAHATVTGTITAGMGGTITGRSTVTGKLILNPNALRGTLTAKATATGTLQLIRPLAGTVSAKATLTGSFKLNPNALAGVSSARATVSGAVKMFRGLTGPVSARATVIGNARIFRALQAIATGHSLNLADLTVIPAFRFPVNGTISSTLDVLTLHSDSNVSFIKAKITVD